MHGSATRRASAMDGTSENMHREHKIVWNNFGPRERGSEGLRQDSLSEFGRTLVRPVGPAPRMALAIPLSAHAQSVGLIHLCDETEDLVRTLRFDKTAG